MAAICIHNAPHPSTNTSQPVLVLDHMSHAALCGCRPGAWSAALTARIDTEWKGAMKGALSALASHGAGTCALSVRRAGQGARPILRHGPLGQLLQQQAPGLLNTATDERLVPWPLLRERLDDDLS